MTTVDLTLSHDEAAMLFQAVAKYARAHPSAEAAALDRKIADVSIVARALSTSTCSACGGPRSTAISACGQDQHADVCDRCDADLDHRARCRRCGGFDGKHGLVHQRHPEGGGGSNLRCPNATD